MHPVGCVQDLLGHVPSFGNSTMFFPPSPACVLPPRHGCHERFEGEIDPPLVAADFHQAVERHVLRYVLCGSLAGQSSRELVCQLAHSIDQLGLVTRFVRLLDVHALLSERGDADSGVNEAPLLMFQQSAFWSIFDFDRSNWRCVARVVRSLRPRQCSSSHRASRQAPHAYCARARLSLAALWSQSAATQSVRRRREVFRIVAAAARAAHTLPRAARLRARARSTRAPES